MSVVVPEATGMVSPMESGNGTLRLDSITHSSGLVGSLPSTSLGWLSAVRLPSPPTDEGSECVRRTYSTPLMLVVTSTK